MAGTSDWVRQYLAERDATMAGAFAQPAAPVAFGAPSAVAQNLAAPYPIRSELTPAAVPVAQAAPGRVAAPAAAGPGAMDYLAAAFPTVVAANASARNDSAEAYAKGETARALGASARRAITVPIAAVNDIVAPPVKGVFGGLANLVGGAFTGASDSSVVRTQPAAAAPRAAAAAATPATKPQKDAPITTQDRAVALLDKILQGPLTLKEFERVAGTLPGVVPPGKARSPKDDVLAQTSLLSQGMYQADAAAVKAALDAGEIDAIGAKAQLQQAQKGFYERQAALSGVDIKKLAEATLYAQQQEGQ